MNALNDAVEGNETLNNMKEWIMTNPKRAGIIAAIVVAAIIIIIIIIVVISRSSSGTVTDGSTTPSPSFGNYSITYSPSLAASAMNATRTASPTTHSPTRTWSLSRSPSLNATISNLANQTISSTMSMIPSFMPSTSPSPNVSSCYVSSYSIPCNGHGMMYPESGGVCECYDCYAGTYCEAFINGCNVDATGGRGGLGLMEEYWTTRHNLLPIVASAIDYRVTVQKDLVTLIATQTTTNALSRKLNQAIIALHKKYNNVLNPERKQIISGPAQSLFLASFYAYSKRATNGSPVMTLYSRTPYYRESKIVCDMLPGYCSFNSSTNLDPTTIDLFEIVSIPGDPDGQEIDRTYTNNSQYAYDLTDYWPHFAQTIPLTPKDGPILYFDLGKLSGHGGTRFGWALVKDVQIASLMRDWLEATMVHSSVDAAARALPILQFLSSNSTNTSTNASSTATNTPTANATNAPASTSVSSSSPMSASVSATQSSSASINPSPSTSSTPILTADNFFTSIRATVLQRWSDVQNLFANKNYGNFTLDSAFGTSYLWIGCPAFLSELKCYAAFESSGLYGYDGADFGQVTAPFHYRLGITVRSYMWPVFLDRLENVLSGTTQKKRSEE